MNLTYGAILASLLIGAAIATEAVADAPPPADAANEEKKEKVDLILELTADNFDATLQNQKHLVIFFYTNDCHRCKEELNDYLSAAKFLRGAGTKIRFAIVHGGKQTALVEMLDIKRFPSIRLVNNGDFANALEYKYVGVRDVSVLSWLMKLAMPVRRIDDSEELLKVTHKRAIPVGFFHDANSPEATVFHSVAKDDADTTYAMTTNSTLLDQLNIGSSAKILFYQPDGTQHVYDGPWDVKSIRMFIDAYSFPVVVPLTHGTTQSIYRTILRRQVILFASKKADNFAAVYDAFETVAKQYRGKLLFIFDDLERKDEDRLREVLGILPNTGAQIRYAVFSMEKVEKYQPADLGAINVDTMTHFIEEVSAKRIEPYTLAESLPKDWDAKPLKKLVAANFFEVTSDRSRNVLVLITSPWCSACNQLIGVMEKVAEYFKDREDVRVAHIDGTKNDVQGFHRYGFPSIRLFLKDSDAPVEYRNGDGSLESLKIFVQSNGKEVRKQRSKDEL